MKQVFIDANVPMYAAGRPHRLQEPCQNVIRSVLDGSLDAFTNTEVFQEILHRYAHINALNVGFPVFDHFFQIMQGRIWAIEPTDAFRARELAAEHPHLTARDWIHLAAMMNRNCSQIITADRGFDRVEQVERIDPTQFA